MSLRLKLFLSYFAIVALVAVVGVLAFGTGRALRSRVANLSRHSGFSPAERSPVGLSLEFEGSWDGRAFTASSIEELPGQRRPKLRGSLNEIDRGRGKIAMYGMTIGVGSSTEFEPADASLATIRAGARAEVSCAIDPDGRWTARRIRLNNIKESDKVKGVVTRYESDGVWPDTMEVSGLRVLVGREKPWKGSTSHLHRIELSTEAALAARRTLASLERVVEGPQPDEAARDFHAATLDLSRLMSELQRSAPGEGNDGQKRLSELSGSTGWLELAADSLVAPGVPARAQAAALYARIQPVILEQLLPAIDTHLGEMQEGLGEEIRDVVNTTERTVQRVLVVSVAALALAVILALLVWRSIARPLTSLSEAAARIGAGRLDTRVVVSSRDELGALAGSFNRMAEQLAASTVSIDNLNAVKGRLRLSLAEKELLLKEVHHRVKNNLQIVSSLLDLQSSHVQDARGQAMLAESRSRIRAMALIHEQLHRSTDVDRIDLATYIRLLADGLAQSLVPSGGRIDIRVDVKPLRLDVDRAVSCGLVINELVTNAIKHAVSDAGGTITILLHEEGREYVLAVADDGPGIPDAAMREGSLGLELVHALTGQLGGRIQVLTGSGTEFRIRFPAGDETAASA